MKNPQFFIRSASLGFLETYDSAGHEWTMNPGKAFPMREDEAKTRSDFLKGAGFTDVETVPVDSVPPVPNIGQLNIAGLASVIRRDWRPVNFAARPYLDAMMGMDSVKDNFGNDSGGQIVLYFLSNAGTWKGRVAKAVKDELKKRLKAAGVRF
jgi:hypothetical protein